MSLGQQTIAQVVGTVLIVVGVGLAGKWWHGVLAGIGVTLVVAAYVDYLRSGR